jgi:phytoene dehydrogenase-like protein
VHRKKFIRIIAASAVGISFFAGACKRARYALRRRQDNSAVAHKLREQTSIPNLAVSAQYDVVIVGAGVSGLSAARYLAKHSKQKVLMLELGDTIGGNARCGENSVTKYPLGAHYLPVPPLHCTELIEFLQEAGVVLAYDNEGLPVYNKEHLVFDNMERLFMHGTWQDGLVPHNMLQKKDSEQIQRFLEFVNSYRYKKDSNGKYLYDIPASNSSKNAAFNSLDKIDARTFLLQNNYHSEALHWYVNYCMCDDYGSHYSQTSAWAMVHYYACRMGKGSAGISFDDELTWPQGNNFLVEKLQQQSKAELQLQALVQKIEGKKITYYQARTNQYACIEARKIILATPAHVVGKILPQSIDATQMQHFAHYPWLVANITVKPLPEQPGVELSWDNVLYGSTSLGYVVANHQHLSQNVGNMVFTYYKPYNGASAKTLRQQLREKTDQQLQTEVIKDLKTVYANIEDYIVDMELHTFGHAMIAPSPHLLSSGVIEEIRKNLPAHITLAHTDFAGISIFEEAFYQGLAAGKWAST